MVRASRRCPQLASIDYAFMIEDRSWLLSQPSEAKLKFVRDTAERLIEASNQNGPESGIISGFGDHLFLDSIKGTLDKDVGLRFLRILPFSAKDKCLYVWCNVKIDPFDLHSTVANDCISGNCPGYLVRHDIEKVTTFCHREGFNSFYLLCMPDILVPPDRPRKYEEMPLEERKQSDYYWYNSFQFTKKTKLKEEGYRTWQSKYVHYLKRQGKRIDLEISLHRPLIEFLYNILDDGCLILKSWIPYEPLANNCIDLVDNGLLNKLRPTSPFWDTFPVSKDFKRIKKLPQPTFLKGGLLQVVDRPGKIDWTCSTCSAGVLMMVIFAVMGWRDPSMGLAYVVGDVMTEEKTKLKVPFQPEKERRKGSKKRNQLFLKGDEPEQKRQKIVDA